MTTFIPLFRVPLEDIRSQEDFLQVAALRFAGQERRLPTRDETRELVEQYRYSASDPISVWDEQRFGERVHSMLDADKHGHTGWRK